jgi:uncharacterized protein
MRPLCIYHGQCADGFTASWIVNGAFKGDVDFVPGVYGQDPPDVTARDIIMVDFSYKRPVLEAMVDKAYSLLILDHHKTAVEDLAGLPAPEEPLMYTPNHWAATGGVRAQFDMDRSGAQMAWDFFFPSRKRPWLVDYIGDRDLWRWKMPNSREVSAYISTVEFTFPNWQFLNWEIENIFKDVVRTGGILERKHQMDVADTVKVTQRLMKIGGGVMPVANVPFGMTSDAGNLMAREALGRAAALYSDTPRGRIFSLRSTEDGPDVSAIAKLYGGGGHAHAAGFQRPIGWEGDE